LPRLAKAIASSAPDIAPHPDLAWQSRRAIIPLGGFVSPVAQARHMPMLQEVLQWRRDIERRAHRRSTINRDVLMFFTGQDRVHDCCVRNVTDHGAGLRLNGVNIVPSEFAISFDRFRTMRLCRLIWRDGDFLGVAFKS
jgi:hypothetical protein